jgi:hypothetical protein
MSIEFKWADNSDVAFERLTASVKRALAGFAAPVRIIEAGCGRKWGLGDLGPRPYACASRRRRISTSPSAVT